MPARTRLWLRFGRLAPAPAIVARAERWRASRAERVPAPTRATARAAGRREVAGRRSGPGWRARRAARA